MTIAAWEAAKYNFWIGEVWVRWEKGNTEIAEKYTFFPLHHLGMELFIHKGIILAVMPVTKLCDTDFYTYPLSKYTGKLSRLW